MSVVVTVEMNTKPGQGGALAGALTMAVKHTITYAACHYANVAANEDDPDHLLIQMVWDDSASHKAYAAGVMADPKMAPVMEMLAGPPRTAYYDLVAHEGQAT